MIDDALRAAIEEEAERFPETRAGLLGALHRVQGEHGCVSLDAARELADLFSVPPVEVLELVRFYGFFREGPAARHEVRVCTNLSCALRGASELLGGLEAHLGVSAGEATSDGRVRLGADECLGACANAPMMRVGDTYHEDLDLARACAVVDELE